MTAVRIHLCFAYEDDCSEEEYEDYKDSILKLLNKFFDFDNDYTLSYTRTVCSHVQMLSFYRTKKDEYEDSQVDVLIPKKSSLNFQAEIDSLQEIIFERLALKHTMMDVLLNNRSSYS